MRKKLIVLAVIIISVMATGVVALPQHVAAVTDPACKTGSLLLLPTWYKYLDVGPKDNDKCAIIGPLSDPADPSKGIDWAKAGGKIGLAVVDILLRLGGLVAVIFVIYGGIRLILSEGEPDNFKKAKETIFNALIGMLIVLVATAAVNFVGSTLLK